MSRDNIIYISGQIFELIDGNFKSKIGGKFKPQMLFFRDSEKRTPLPKSKQKIKFAGRTVHRWFLIGKYYWCYEKSK